MKLEARRRWTLTKLGRLINTGRNDGWLPGEVIEGVAELHEVEVNDAASPMGVLGSRLRLSHAEIETLWILACIELFPDVAAGSQVLVSHGMHELNAQVMEQLTSIDEQGLVRLARLGLVETSADGRVPRFRRSLRASDRVLELARGRFELDPALRGLATLEPGRGTRDMRGDAFVVAIGVEGCGRLDHVRAAGGCALLVVQCARLSEDADRLAHELRMLAREAALHDAAVVLRDVDRVARFELVEREVLAGERPVLATARAMAAWTTTRTIVPLYVALPEPAHRAVLWEDALPGTREDVIAECARRYTVSPATIASAAKSAAALAGNGAISVGHVHLALRTQLERKLSGVATRIETKQTWDDLVLPADQQDVLLELLSRVRHRGLVMDAWGFADKIGRGLGLSVLLSGPPGTGKTMIAGLLAKELGLDLYQVDMSKLVSKYIGETEKQLGALFDAAESGHAILLFDEADSLFGKRTEVKSSNDRYANLEVNYLLQRMEQFTGISILTTNHEKAIDPAFQRRLAFHLRVPMPDAEQRAVMWTTMIPAKAARAANLNVAKLASGFVMSGGYIKNAVVRAAFLAAGEGAVICTAHLERAARLEYEAMGKIAS
jgi:ATPase family associated with various cellular activities (AAA)